MADFLMKKASHPGRFQSVEKVQRKLGFFV